MRSLRPHRRRLGPLLALSCLLAGPAASAEAEPAPRWHAVRSPHFVIFTNAGPQRGREIAVNLELFRAVFARLAPALELRSPAPTKILAFRDAASYAPYKTAPDRPGARVLGQFLSHPDGNYLTLEAGSRQVGSHAVIYHEYVHYFVRHNFPDVPLWFNEGLAEYYSTFATGDGTVRVGRPVERHLGWLQRDGEISLANLLSVTRDSPDYHDGDQAGRFYAVSWALVHYLLSGGDKRLDQTADYLLRLADGEDPDGAFEEAFDTRLSGIEEALRRYVLAGELPEAAIPVRTLRPPAVGSEPMRPAEVQYHLGDLVAHVGRTAQAERHFHRALDLDPTHADAHAGLALVRDLENRYEEADLLYRDAIELGSANPLTYLLFGRHLLTVLQGGGEIDRAAVAEEARSALARVVALDPDYGEGYVLLGVAHLVGEVDPEPGIRALERARQLLPHRPDVVFHLVQLVLRQHAFDRAEGLVEGPLARRADPEMLARAREEVARSRLVHAAEEALRAGEVEDGLRLYDEAISVTSDPARREAMEARLLALQARLGGR